MDVSVCIPTANRPELLKAAIESCLAQSLQPCEILIGDDSVDHASTLEALCSINSTDVKLRIVHNAPRLGQARNVARLFEEAKGKYLVLLHDDDLLLPNAIEQLVHCFKRFPQIVGAFGKQKVMSESGHIDERASEHLNCSYHRTVHYRGIIAQPLESAISQQFPNDAFMVDAEFARRAGYDSTPESGNACDFAFALSLAALGRPLYFIDEYVAVYRNTAESIGRGPGKIDDAALCAVRMLMALNATDDSLSSVRHAAIAAKLPVAIGVAIKMRDLDTATSLWFSRYHRQRMFTPRGLWSLWKILESSMTSRLNRSA